MKPKNSPTLDLIELTIDSLSYNGGRGVGRFDGIVVFVPGTAPQDRIRAQVVSRKPRFWEAELVEILTPSPYRRTPPCPVAARCGGCSWQHVQYSSQIVQKEKILSDSLRSLAKFGEISWLPFVPASEEFHYRNRIQVQVRDGRKGFFAKRTNELVAVENCWIAEEAINQRLKELVPEHGVRKVEIAVDERGNVLTMTDARDPEAALFSQVNTAQNARMKNLVLELIDFTPEWVMDLYCGAGNFTFPLAEKFPTAAVLGVELSQASIARARENSLANSRIEWIAQDVARALKRRDAAHGAGLVILDPPRTGCESDVIAELKRHQPKQIVYVSCNPSTFARDGVRLLENGGYRLESVRGLDMFPQTEHVELIASFKA